MNINIKYYYRKTVYLLLLSLLLPATACMDSRVITDDDNGGEDVLIMLNLKGLFGEGNVPPVYSLTPGGDQEGAGREQDVNDVTVFIFNASTNVCEKIFQKSSPVDMPIGPELAKSGNKKIVAVVNGINKFNDVKSPWYAPGDENLITYNGLRTTLTEAISHLPASPFLMTGEVSATLQAGRPTSSPNQVTIEVERAVAKAKIFVTKSGNAAQHNLYLQKVTLHQGADRVSVLKNNAPLSGITCSLDSTVSAGSFKNKSGAPSDVIPEKSSGDYCFVDTFYTYESLALHDKSKAVYFDFEVGVGVSTNIRTCRVYLAEDPLPGNDTIYNVYRNYWYNVYVDITDPGLDSVYVRIEAARWDVAPTITVTPGAGFEAKTASPFKLVKYYDADDIGKNKLLPVIDKHSKGASWIDLKVTPDTIWNLEFTSGAAGNLGAIFSADTGKTWQNTPLSGKGGSEQRIYIYRPYEENNELKEGPSLELKIGANQQHVRTFVVAPRDSLIFPTNSYVVRPENYNQGSGNSNIFIPLNHVYDFWEDFIYANGDSVPANVTPSVTLSWQDTTGTVVQASPTIINPSDRKNSYIRAEAGSVQGNAILDFKAGTTVYWSFHIWNTEYSPYEPAGQILYITSGNVKNIFMDRNLGAMDTIYTPSGTAEGLNYQFGRKDPFPRGETPYSTNFKWYGAPAGQQQTTITTASQPTAAAAVRPRTAIPAIINNPTTFYTGDFYNHNVEDSCLWNTKGGNKTAFDPCPEGYRIPIQANVGSTYSPWNGTTATPDLAGSYLYFSPSTSHGQKDGKRSYFPMNVISYNGTLDNSTGFYWISYGNGSSKTATAAYGMAVLSGSHDDNATKSKSTGAKVRCVVDKNYILYKKGTIFGRYTAEIINDL